MVTPLDTDCADSSGKQFVVDVVKGKIAKGPGGRRRLLHMDALFTFRMASQQVDNALNAWLDNTVGSIARYQILAVLWGADGEAVGHGDLVSALRVKRATISGLMAGLERDGLVESTVDEHDLRRLQARLTKRGEKLVREATDARFHQLDAVFSQFTKTELETLNELVERVRNGFARAGAAG